MNEKQRTCQVCRLLPAVKQVTGSNGKKMWRCLSCAELKNRAGFTKGKQ